MKKICVDRHIITFVDDGQIPEVADDVTLVTRLSESPDAAEEVRALARMILALREHASEKNNGRFN